MQSGVGVVIPCYRCADTIQRAVDSVLQQTRAATEIILVDDYSDDAGATLNALRALQRAHGADLIHIVALDKNAGPGGARNAGWAMVQSQYLAFLDADDSWHPRKLEIQLAWMQAHPEAMLTAAHSTLLQVDAPPPALSLPPTVQRITSRALLLSNRCPTRTVMLRSDLGLRFDPAKRYAEDYLLWLGIVLAGMPAYVIALPLGFTYKAEFGEAGLTASLWKMELGEIDTYKRVCAAGQVSKPAAGALVFFSMLKFVRRLAISALSRRPQL